jgi:hypothetical protein
VQIAESRQGWLRILTPIPAWVKEDFVTRALPDVVPPQAVG